MTRIMGTSPSVLARDFPLGKADIDHIFTLDLSAWEAYVKTLALPANWGTTLQRHASGTGLLALDKDTGAMLGICPTYADEHGAPARLTITTAHQQGNDADGSNRPAQLLQDMIQNAVGTAYSVFVANTTSAPSEIVEVSVVRRS